MVGEQLTGAEIIIRSLVDQGVEYIFGYPGGAVLPIYDELFKQNSIKHILVRHEQGAVHAAEGYARSSGKPGVVLVTSGPGATNAVTGLTDALLDSIPLVCLTGQVPTHLIGSDAFQECDTVGITRQATKHNYLVKSADNLAQTMHEAFFVATHGRPGPVLVDVPKDIQFAKGMYVAKDNIQHKTYRPKTSPDSHLLETAIAMLASAKKPMIYGGGGLINSGPEASKLLRRFVDLTNFPCTLTLMGLGALPASHPNFLGMLGMHGTFEANWAMHDCDVMLCIGARFDDRITGRLDGFAPHSRKIHIDIDPSSINKNVIVDLPIIGDCSAALTSLIDLWQAQPSKPPQDSLTAWWAQIKKWRAKDSLAFTQKGPVIRPQHAISRLNDLTKSYDTFISTEVGQHQMWAAQHFHFEKPNHWMTSGGLGTMGYGLPAAIGTQLAHPEALVIDIAGEASILMNMQEISTAVQYRLPVKIFILNNKYMGMVRQWQELLHGSRYSESYSEALPDFVKLAEAYGAMGLRIEQESDLDAGITAMIDHNGPVIVDVVVEPNENCFPMIPSGAAHHEMLLGPVSNNQDAIGEKGKILV